MKKRIFFYMHELPIGGAERALLCLLNTIDYGKYDVDLMVGWHNGEMMKMIPERVNLLPENKAYKLLYLPEKEAFKAFRPDIAIAKYAARARKKLYRIFNPLPAGKDDLTPFYYTPRYTTPLLPSLRNLGKYDLAVSFLAPHHVVAEKVDAKTKVAWIHYDYSKCDSEIAKERKIWSKYDKIVSLSPKITEIFVSQWKDLSGRIVEIHNILSSKIIKAEAGDVFPEEYSSDCLNILSIGRICPIKNFTIIPHIAKELKSRGLKFRWTILGPGDRQPIRDEIAATGTEDCVFAIWGRENPYPYLNKADIYVQTSLSEANSVVVEEAKILCRPIVVTPYPTAHQQIQNGVTGIVASDYEGGLVDAIYNLAVNPAEREKLTANLSSMDLGNESEVEKFYALIDNK